MTKQQVKAEILKGIEESIFKWASVGECLEIYGEVGRIAIEELVAEKKITRRFKKSGSGVRFQIIEALNTRI